MYFEYQIWTYKFKSSKTSNLDNDVYCICTHDTSICTHKKFRPVRTMYNVAIYYVSTVVIPYRFSPSSASARLTVYQLLMVVWHFGLFTRNSHFASLMVIVFNLKFDVFHVLQPSQFIIFSSFFSFIIYEWDKNMD